MSSAEPQRALVIGEALIDIVERAGSRTEYVGGSPLNVAVGLARLGRTVDFLTHIGDDERGQRIVEYVESAGAQLVTGSTSAARTPTALAALDQQRSASYEFDIEWQLTGTPEVGPPLVVHTGSIAAMLEPGCRPTAALVDTYHPSATVTIDPNVRPALIEDASQDAQAARGRVDRLIERCDVVKASDEDMRWLDPGRSPEQIAQTWLTLGPSVVAVTMGPRGSFALCADGLVRVPAFEVEVVDTVGAGDGFMAGLIDALWALGLLGAERRRDLARIGTEALTTAMRTAAMTAALTLSRAGADLPDRGTRDAALKSAILG
jgi:fructokinase